MAQKGCFSFMLPQCRTTNWHEVETPQNFCHWLLVSAIHSTVNQDVKMVVYYEEWLTRSLSRHSVETHTWRERRKPWKVLVSLISYPAKTVPTTSQTLVLHVNHLINMGTIKNWLSQVNGMKPLRKLTKHNLLSIIWIRIWKFRFGYKLNVLLKHKESISAWVFVHNICRKFHWNYIFANIIFVKMSFKKIISKCFLKSVANIECCECLSG
jgi:hypothetical protein